MFSAEILKTSMINTGLLPLTKYLNNFMSLKVLVLKLKNVSIMPKYSIACLVDVTLYFQGGTSVVVPYCYLFLLSVFYFGSTIMLVRYFSKF